MVDLRALVDKSLAGFLIEDAKFYAERLYYEQPSQENLYLLAQCYFRQNKIKQCYLILQGSKLLSNRYLLATCCFTLGKLEEAEFVLTGGQTPALQTAAVTVPGGAMGLYLLGCICRRGHRKDPAIKYFTMSLQVWPCSHVASSLVARPYLLFPLHPSHTTPQLDSTLWGSITELCDLGAPVNIDPLFGCTLEAASRILSADAAHSQPRAPNHNHDRASALDDRHLAESGTGAAGTPTVALSLGMSSALYHVPLATPGSVPMSAQSFEPRHGHFTDYDGGFEGGYSHAEAASAQTAQSGASAMTTGPRVALFDMSTPGLTPIQQGSLTHSGGALGGVHSATTGGSYAMQGMGMDTDAGPGDGRFHGRYGEPGSGPPTGAFAAFHDASGGDAMRTGPDSSHYLHRDGEGAAGGGVAGGGGAFLPQRRVSFGPTARLSFSGLGGADLLGGDGPNQREGEGEGEGGQEEGEVGEDKSDENPTKVQRMADLERVAGPGGGRLGEASPGRYSRAGHDGSSPLPPRPRLHPPPHVPPTTSAPAAAVLTVLSHAYSLLSQYLCRDCVAALHRLPARHFASGFAQQLLGRAYCEMNEYKPASLALREMLRLEPFRTAGTEVLSTTLWHLKREKELCALAQQVVEVDSGSPQAWCVVGNCLSLQREPEAAIKFFQVRPRPLPSIPPSLPASPPPPLPPVNHLLMY